MSRKYTYELLHKVFLEKECQLQLTEEEYSQINILKNTRLYFRAKCGHNSSASFTNFMYKNTGIICWDCNLKNCSQKMTKYKNSHIGESLILAFLLNIINPVFDIQKTNEGCVADLIIKPKDNEKDEWLKIQLKTTEKLNHGIYVFSGINKNYENCLILCSCLPDHKIWMIPHCEIKHLISLSIGKTNSIYNKYLVAIENITDELYKHYQSYILSERDECMKPISLQQYQEIEFSERRINRLDFLNFKKSQIDGEVYDFILNGFKHQEKVATYIMKKDCHIIHLCKHNGTENKKNKWQFYHINDNDFYWFWIKDRSFFYIIPASILLKYDCITDSIKEGNKIILLYPHRKSETKYNFLDDYKFDLDHLDKERLLELLQITIETQTEIQT